MLNYSMAGGLGFEPRLTESESKGKTPKIPYFSIPHLVLGLELPELGKVVCGCFRRIIVAVGLS